MGVDVQRSVFYWVVRGFDRDGTSYLVDHGTAVSFDDLSSLGETYECAYGIVDTGYRTQEMYEEIHQRRPFWFGAKGFERMPQPYKMTGVDPFAVVQGKVKKSGYQSAQYQQGRMAGGTIEAEERDELELVYL